MLPHLRRPPGHSSAAQQRFVSLLRREGEVFYCVAAQVSNVTEVEAGESGQPRGCVRIDFPTPEFDDTLDAVRHGLATEAEMRALNNFLRSHSSTRDEDSFRLELRVPLAFNPDPFVEEAHRRNEDPGFRQALKRRPPFRIRGMASGCARHAFSK